MLSKIDRNTILEKVAAKLKEAGSMADYESIIMVVESHEKFESDIISTLDQVSRLVEMVYLPNVKVLADAFHMSGRRTTRSPAADS